MDIIQDYIPQSRRNRPGYKLITEYITIHDTANSNKGANAQTHAKYLKGDSAANIPVSWHFSVDDKEVVQHLPLDEIAWHAGDGGNGPGNNKSIGIEICENSDGNRTNAEEKAAILTAMLLNQYGLTIDKVVQHNHWSGKNCPHILRARPGGWEQFVQNVESHMIKAKEDTTEEVTVIENGVKHSAVRHNGSTYVQLKTYAQKDGKTVSWDESTKTATVTGGKLEQIRLILEEVRS